MRLEKIFNYTISLMREYASNVGNYDLRFAHWVLWSSLAPRLNMHECSVKAQDRKNKYILRFIDGMSKEETHAELSKKVRSEKPQIWMFWWTGLSSAPDIVKMSVNSVRANAKGFEVHVLDQNNYQEYIELPQYVIEKHDRGLITHAMFSDILRVTLLSVYGGVWIDATILCLRQLPDFLKTVDYYTCKTYDRDSQLVSKSRWTSFFLAGSQEFGLFSKSRELLFSYWRIYDTQIDYLLIDYIFAYIWIKDKEIRRKMRSLPDNNFRRNELFGSLNEPYSEEMLNEFINDDTFVYKCSWRYGTLTERNSEGVQTLYGFLKDLFMPN